jgi:hypothetical protein
MPGRSHRVITVVLESKEEGASRADRETAGRLILQKVENSVKGRRLLIFPAGWFSSGKHHPKKLVESSTEKFAANLKRHGGRSVCIYGVDGRESGKGTLDQLAVAVSDRGILGLARKFYSSPSEVVDSAVDWQTEEAGWRRCVNIFGRVYYLAVCYDGFGLKQLKGQNPGVDAIVDVIHKFTASGVAGSGDVMFARHGLAGASQAWRVPVFGAVCFFGRSVPPKWPSGVKWKGKSASTMTWSYSKNAIAPVDEFEVELKEGAAQLRVFDPWSA